MRYINIKFPLNDDENNYLFKLNNTTKDAITSNLLLLLLTEKGERYYNPNYGTNLIKYIFEPNDDITVKDIEKDIRDTVSTFMPNITISSIIFDEESTDKDINRLNVMIKFVYSENAFTESGVINLTF